MTSEQQLKVNIRNLSPRQFGESLCEQLINIIIPDMTISSNSSYDRNWNNDRIELKFARAMNSVKHENIFKSISMNGDYIFSNSNDTSKLDCNIQQVKPSCFDIIIYGIFFNDVIYIFKATSHDIENDVKIGYCNKQHRGNIGEGQFHIKRNNIQYHIDNFLYKKLTWPQFNKIIENEIKKYDN